MQLQHEAAGGMQVGTIVAIVLMLLGMSMMGSLVFVVTHHPALSTDEYKVAIWMGIQYTLGYAVMGFVYTSWYRKKRLWPLLKLVGFPTFGNMVYSVRVGGLIGCLWSFNYVCILVAGPFIPNAMQTVFAQLQMVVTYLVNFKLYKNPLHYSQHLIIGLFVGVSLGSGVFVQGSGLFSVPGLSTGKTVLWCLVYLLNSLAAGTATNCVEALMEAARDDHAITVPATPEHPQGKHAPRDVVHRGYDELDFILAINVVSGIWMVAFDIIPLFGIAWLSYGNDVWSQVFTNWTAMGSGSGQLYIFLLSLSSWVYTTASYYALVQIDALFVAVVIAICNVGQVAIFNNQSLVTGVYYSEATIVQWEVNAVAAVLSIAYALWPRLAFVDGRLRITDADPDKNERVRTSIVGRFYETALVRGKQDFDDNNEDEPLI